MQLLLEDQVSATNVLKAQCYEIRPMFEAPLAATAQMHGLTCALMVPGFRVAAAAVEAEAGPDLRELSIDDWDSALEEAGDTLVVVDFFTNW